MYIHSGQICNLKSDWKGIIEGGNDPNGFTVKFIDKSIGKGVFADKKVAAGSFLFEYAGELISRQEALHREKTYPLRLGSFLFFFRFGRKQLCLDATFSSRIGRYVNDGTGAEQNAETRLVCVNGKPHIGVFSIKNILPGQEIRYDYGDTNLPWRADNKKTKCKGRKRKRTIDEECALQTSVAELSTGRKRKRTIDEECALQTSVAELSTGRKRKRTIDKECALQTSVAELSTGRKRKRTIDEECALQTSVAELSTGRKRKRTIDEECALQTSVAELSTEQKRKSATKERGKRPIKPPNLQNLKTHETARLPIVRLYDMLDKTKGCPLEKELTRSVTLSRLQSENPQNSLVYKDKTRDEQITLTVDENSDTSLIIKDGPDRPSRTEGLSVISKSCLNETQNIYTEQCRNEFQNKGEKGNTSPQNFTVITEESRDEYVALRVHIERSTHIERPDELSETCSSDEPDNAMTTLTKKVSSKVNQRDTNTNQVAFVSEECTPNAIVTRDNIERNIQTEGPGEISTPSMGEQQNSSAEDCTDKFQNNGEKGNTSPQNFTVITEESRDEYVALRVHIERSTHVERPDELAETCSSDEPDNTITTFKKQETRKGEGENTYGINEEYTHNAIDIGSNLERSTQTEMPVEITETYSREDQGSSNTELNNQVTTKGKKPHRPCPFCGEFKAKLSEHLKTKHKDLQEVQDAIALPKHEQIEAFANLRKMGIFKANIKLLRENSSNESTRLIRERQQGNDKLVTCLSCKAFLSRPQFYRHKRKCGKGSYAKPPSFMEPSFLVDMKLNKSYVIYQSEILSKFMDDEIGKVCRKDNYIVAFGFQKYLSFNKRKSKKDEKRKGLMANMRLIGSYYMSFQKCLATANMKTDTCSLIDMFSRKHIQYFKETVESRKTKSGSNLNDGYIIKRFGKFLHNMMACEGQDDIASEIQKFLDALTYLWVELFGDAELNILLNRSDTRKPSALPDEADIEKLKNFTTDMLKTLTDDAYNFIVESEFKLLRDLLVSRLTLFNARRGGEPSRLLVSEWQEAENDVWIQKSKHTIFNSEDMETMKQFKIAYQEGKQKGKLVPVIFPLDCLKGLRIIANPEVRKDAGVKVTNSYLFPRTQLSDFHVIGTDSIDGICKKANVSSITATKIRHRAATLYAGMDVPESERQAFYTHMGHSGNINTNVYQCPPAILEVTKVGKFLKKLDEGRGFNEASSADSTQAATSTSNKGLDSCEASTSGLTKTASSTCRKRLTSEEIQDSESENSTGSSILRLTSEESQDSESENSFGSSLEESRQVGQCIDQRRAEGIGSITEYENKTSSETTDNDRQYVHWSKEDTMKVNTYFHKYIYDVSREGVQGSLPGYADIRQFLKLNPGVLSHLSQIKRIKTVHTKLFNERNKSRRIAKKTLSNCAKR